MIRNANSHDELHISDEGNSVIVMSAYSARDAASDVEKAFAYSRAIIQSSLDFLQLLIATSSTSLLFVLGLYNYQAFNLTRRFPDLSAVAPKKSESPKDDPQSFMQATIYEMLFVLVEYVYYGFWEDLRRNQYLVKSALNPVGIKFSSSEVDKEMKRARLLINRSLLQAPFTFVSWFSESEMPVAIKSMLFEDHATRSVSIKEYFMNLMSYLRSVDRTTLKGEYTARFVLGVIFTIVLILQPIAESVNQFGAIFTKIDADQE